MTTKPMSESIQEVIARSSLGGYAWCATCKHPDLNHTEFLDKTIQDGACVHPGCICPGLQRMTPEEWLRWKGHL